MLIFSNKNMFRKKGVLLCLCVCVRVFLCACVALVTIQVTFAHFRTLKTFPSHSRMPTHTLILNVCMNVCMCVCVWGDGGVEGEGGVCVCVCVCDHALMCSARSYGYTGDPCSP